MDRSLAIFLGRFWELREALSTDLQVSELMATTVWL